MSYYISKTTDLSFDESLIKVEEELKKEGFGILTEIDVQATFKKKLDVDFKKYKILGACNPTIAHKALTSEDKLGVLLPCNIVVEENDNNEVEVSAVNPIVAMGTVGNESLGEFASMITEKLQKVIDNI